MSVPGKGRTLPKSGKELHLKGKRQARARRYAEAIAEALREELQHGASVKTVMGWTGAGERTVKAWLARKSGPSGEHLVALVHSSELVYERVLTLADRSRIADRRGLEALRDRLVDLTSAIDAMSSTSGR
jgi:hypothetical protein